jgi:hypothetical protein
VQRQAMAVYQQLLQMNKKMMELETGRLRENEELAQAARGGRKQGLTTQGQGRRLAGDKRQKMDTGGYRLRHAGKLSTVLVKPLPGRLF